MFFLPLIFAVTAEASTVLIQAPQSPQLDYRASLRAHSTYVSPSQEYLARHPLPEHREGLLGSFAEAQKSFLELSLEEARRKMQAVLALLPTDDWDKSDREIFLQCYLRLAQMESDPEARDRWLGLSTLLPDAGFDDTLYPPPLIARRNELLKQFPRKIIARRELAPGWNQVLINGVRCSTQDCGSWPLYPGPVRVTTLSDEYLPQSAAMQPAEIERFRPPIEAWVEGRCDSARFHPEADRFANKKVFWNLACERPHDLNLLAPPAADPILAQVESPAPKARPIYQSPWLWAGLGAAVVAAIVIGQSHVRERTTPTSSYGY